MPKKPVKKEYQPVQMPDEPVQKPDEPVQKKDQPVKKEKQPVQMPDEPVQKPDEPVQKKDQPVKKEDQPVQMPDEPVQKPEEPMQKKDQQVKKEDEPAQEPEEPVQNPDDPVEDAEVQKSDHPLENPPVQESEEPVEDPNPYEYPKIPYPSTYENARNYLKAKWERPMLWSAFAEIDHGNHRYERISYHTLYKAFVQLKISECETFEEFKRCHIGPFLQRDKVVFNPVRFGWWRYIFEFFSRRPHKDRDADEREITRDWQNGGQKAEKERRKTVSYVTWRNTRGNKFVDKLVSEGKHYKFEPILDEDEWKISEALTKAEKNEFARKWHVNFKRETDRRCCMGMINRSIRNHATRKEAGHRRYTQKWLDREEFDEGRRALHGIYVDGERQRLILERRNRQIEKCYEKEREENLWNETWVDKGPRFHVQPDKTTMTAEDYPRVSAIHSNARWEHELHKNDPEYRTPCFSNIGEIFLRNKPATFYPETGAGVDQDAPEESQIETEEWWWESKAYREYRAYSENIAAVAAAERRHEKLGPDFELYTEDYWQKVEAHQPDKRQHNPADDETERREAKRRAEPYDCWPHDPYRQCHIMHWGQTS